MKYVAIILSFYFLALNLMTCPDNDNIVESERNHVTYQQDSNHNQEHLDLCSPFCSCQCCQVQTSISDSMTCDLVDPKVSLEILTHFCGPTKDIRNFILQPPQV